MAQLQAVLFGIVFITLMVCLINPTPGGTSNSSRRWRKWCGKNFDIGSPVETPVGKFESSSEWAIRCTPVLQPYIAGDPVFLLVDLATEEHTELNVVNSETGLILFSGSVRSKAKIGPLAVGSARLEPHQITCRAPIGSHSLQLSLLPRASSRIVQLDAESGFFKVYDNQGTAKPFFPFGFFTSFGGYMDTSELSTIIADMKDRRVNTVHLVPGGPSITDLPSLERVLRSLDNAGIWIQYDMRHCFYNLTQVGEHVKVISSQPNLLSYYTADEPDGPGYPAFLPERTHDYLRDVDPYHSVALTLACDDFHFTEYTAGTEIIMTDPYMIGMKSPNFAPLWGTECNTTYGDCGCDNCEGNFKDITHRISSYRSRREKLGRTRSMQIWGVPQAFQEDTYWTRQPTYEEFILSCTLYVLEGAVGLMGWIENHDMSPEIKRATKVFGCALEKMIDYLTFPNLYLDQPVSLDIQNTIRSRHWTDPKTGFTLIMTANLSTLAQSWSLLSNIQHSAKSLALEEIFSSSVVKSPQVDQTGMIRGELGALGCCAVILRF